MKYDKPLHAILIGQAAGPVIEIFSQTMKHLDLTTLSATETISLMWLKEPNMALGTLGAIGISSWVSLIIYYSTKFLGTDYLPFKAMLIGMTSESLVFNIFGVLANNSLLIQDVGGNFVHATAAALAGLLTGFLFEKFLFTKKT